MGAGCADFWVLIFCEIGSREGEGEGASLWHHGVSSVDAEVHDDLLDHVFVGVDQWDFVVFAKLDANAFA